VRVRPVKPGAVIRDPHTRRQLPADGGRVADNMYWRRRLAAGEVVPCPEPAPIVPLTTGAAEPQGDER